VRQIKVTVSGSFTRHLVEIQRAVYEFKKRGIRVLSPEQPIVVDALDGFVFVASDRHRSVKLVQDRHLASIASSDFLWLETPDGHVGSSAALELGFAVASGTPVYSTSRPDDLTMQQYVSRVPDIAAALSRAGRRISADQHDHVSLLVDPLTATATAATGIEHLREMLTCSSRAVWATSLEAAVSNERGKITRALSIPTITRE
jgi:hypothetical protein